MVKMVVVVLMGEVTAIAAEMEVGGGCNTNSAGAG